MSCFLSLCLTQEAEVGGSSVPEPFDMRTEHAMEARALNFDEAAEVGTELGIPNDKLDKVCIVYTCIVTLNCFMI